MAWRVWLSALGPNRVLCCRWDSGLSALLLAAVVVSR